MIGTADLHTAIEQAWNESGLNTLFRALCSETGKEDYLVLNGQVGTPKPLFPYCVMETGTPTVRTRMSGNGAAKKEFRDTTVTFHVHAKKADSRSAKQTAAYLVEEVMKVFGGHPSVGSNAITLSNGSVLSSQYQNDFPVQEELYECKWVVAYRFLVDVPVALGSQ